LQIVTFKECRVSRYSIAFRKKNQIASSYFTASNSLRLSIAWLILRVTPARLS
jgi:hypothetical protein